MTLLAGEAWVDVAALARMRGVDVAECEGKRSLAVETHDREHELEARHAAMREERNRAWWKRLTPWRED